MPKMVQRTSVGVYVACVFALTACDKLVDSSHAVQSVTKAAYEDTKSSWKDFFTYHPPIPDSLPQTRYCYQMQSDVVCYDSEQRQLTSKLVGYQDGENISWVQPGGGSLGASGGEPVALRPVSVKPTQVSTQQHYSADESTIDTGPVTAATATSSSHESSNAWVYDKAKDVYRKGTVAPADAVSVSDLSKAK